MIEALQKNSVVKKRTHDVSSRAKEEEEDYSGKSPMKFFLLWFGIPLVVVILAIWLLGHAS